MPVGAPRKDCEPALGSCGALRKKPAGRRYTFRVAVCSDGPEPSGYTIWRSVIATESCSHAVAALPNGSTVVQGFSTPVFVQKPVVSTGSWPMLPLPMEV